MIKTREELIRKYIEFFESKGHKEIPSSSLIPENDPTVLFTTAGMHPLVPFLLGEKHPLGKRLVNVQKCVRTGDIDDVGDEVHHTFFEMLGNWSLGEYWKEEALEYTFEFHTKILGIPLERYAVSCFEGDRNAEKDEESAKIWQSLGIKKERIAFFGKDNWWGPAGDTGPCGPCTEQFYWSSDKKAPEKFDPENKNWVEIGNDVLMQYVKTQRTLLIDGMHCLYDKEFKINEKLINLLDSINTRKIIVVNGNKEKAEGLLGGKGYEVFSLDGKINKDSKEFFERLLERCSLNPDDVIYIDHNVENVKSAEKVGINLSLVFDNDLSKINKFLETNTGKFISAKQKNIDFGGGVERTLAVLNGLNDNYLTTIFLPLIKKIEKISGKKYKGNERAMRIIADHVRAGAFILGDSRGIKPGNVGQGYVLRRLIRRAIRYGKILGIEENFTAKIAQVVIGEYEDYHELRKNRNFILTQLDEEENKFRKTLEEGLKLSKKLFDSKIPLQKEKFRKIMQTEEKKELLRYAYRHKKEGKGYAVKEVNISEKEIDGATITGKEAFYLYQSFGFPVEMIIELVQDRNLFVDVEGFKEELKKHQELSRTASAGTFKSGLADNSEITTRLHTATHLLNEALRIVLNDNGIKQKGSNINPDRLRFDFNFPRKVSDEELEKIERWVNDRIKEELEVRREEMPVKKAFDSGAEGEFGAKYPEIVSVYTIVDKNEKKGWISKEICTGPHVRNTREIGKFKILKEESVAAGIRRIKACVG
jgi:alanyl-tRNA synthetase